MKPQTIYVDEISGAQFDHAHAALKSEKRSAFIRDTFAFVHVEKSEHCEFENGEYSVQHTAEYYEQFRTALIAAVNKCEPWIAKEFGRFRGKKAEWMCPGGGIGHYLSHGPSPIYHWYCIWWNICPTCFREWGQGYYKTHCKHGEVEEATK